MFIDKFPKLTYEEIISVEWNDDPEEYDLQIYELCSKHAKCFVTNPDLSNPHLPFFIEEIPEHQNECIIYYYKDEWIAKLFFQGWTLDKGYKEVHIKPVQTIWRKNPDLDSAMTFIDNPFGKFEPDPWDCVYTMTWYMDPALNPTEDKIWVMTCECVGIKSQGIKDMGFLSPDINLEYNQDLPILDLDIDNNLPAYWDLQYTCAYSLHPSHIKKSKEKMWVVKITPNYRSTKGWKWIGEITPEYEIIYNPELPIMNYDLDLSLTDFNDFRYDNVYMLDRAVLDNSQDDLWAFKVRWMNNFEGAKIIGEVQPSPIIELNPDLKGVEFDIEKLKNLDVQYDDFNQKQVWYIDLEFTKNHKVWAVKRYFHGQSQEVNMGCLIPKDQAEFDVFFISYDESNAEENWQRLSSICPRAQRIKGIKGILEAHKSAAKKSKTSMFYVVDADSFIVDDFKFDYIPGIFDSNVIHVWHSQNPFNKNVYGHGGVKLFPTSIVRKAKTWSNDLTTSLGPLKVIPEISNETRFNSNAFVTWRSAFREMVKLEIRNDNESRKRLNIWEDIDFDQPFSDWVARASTDAQTFVGSGQDLSMINDYDLLKKFFEKRYPNVGK